MPRPITLDAMTRELLARVWRDHGRPTLALERRAVAELEAGLKTKLRDDVLAILVAEGRLPSAITELTQTVETAFANLHGQLWKRQADFDHVIFAQLPTDPAKPAYIGFRRKPPFTFAVWDLHKPRKAGESSSLSDYIERRWTTDPNVHLDQYASAEDVAAFVPVVDDPPTTEPRRVRHAKHGVGVVLGEQDGKLRIQFADGEQLLAEAFVTTVVD